MRIRIGESSNKQMVDGLTRDQFTGIFDIWSSDGQTRRNFSSLNAICVDFTTGEVTFDQIVTTSAGDILKPRGMIWDLGDVVWELRRIAAALEMWKR